MKQLSADSCTICKALQFPANLLTTDYWVVILANDQGYLGRCFVTLREHKAALSDLSHAEWEDFALIVKRLEQACHEVFGAEPFNWAAMMNNAYQTDPVDPHVHWHFRPRYKHPVEILGHTFSDPEFGNHYDRDQRDHVDTEVFEEIIRLLKLAL